MFSGRNATAQVLTVTDTSDAHAMRIKSTINANREIVDFIEHSLAQRKLPKHLRNLPLLESGFDRTRVSSTGAVGYGKLCQLMLTIMDYAKAIVQIFIKALR